MKFTFIYPVNKKFPNFNSLDKNKVKKEKLPGSPHRTVMDELFSAFH